MIIGNKINKYKKYFTYSYGYKLVCAGKSIKLFKSYLGEDGVCNFINGMIKENKYILCSNVMKNFF